MFASSRSAIAACAAVILLAAAPAWAATTVKVSLWDKGGDMLSVDGLGHGMGGDMSKATMGVTATPGAVKAGKVTFDVTNDSKDTVHEVIVAPLKSPGEVLPYIAAEKRVAEEKAGHLGEVSELDPGASGHLGLTLKPGTYILYCNIPGHYMAGMWTLLEVKK